MQAYLKKHGPDFQGHSIKINWQRQGQLVTIEFQVQKRLGADWQTDPAFSSEFSKNWGLWNKDVIEAFLQLRTEEGDLTAPYLEIQVSPLNQPFALIIKEPRKLYYAPDETLDLKTEVSVEGKLWTGKMIVTLPHDLKGSHLYGGFFSIISNPKEYYALDPNKEAGPDFHRPELFLKLDD